MRWIVDNEEYDLEPFLDKHPGGPDLLLWSHGRDITIPVYAFHKDPKRSVIPILRKYKVQPSDEKKNMSDPRGEDGRIKSKLGLPSFLLPDKFEAKEDIPQYDFDFDNDKLLLNTARKMILEKDVQSEIKRQDALFDQVVLGLVGIYFVFLFLWLQGYVPWWIAVPLFTVLRTSIAGGGHYFVHRKKPYFADCAFDINYVGMAFTAQDGHVLIHHAYTQSDADVKRGFFGGMMGIPRLFRMPVHTLHKLGHVTTGMFIRGVDVETEPNNDDHQGVQKYVRQKLGRPVQWNFWLVHTWLRIELVLALWNGLGLVWLLQFCTTLWSNTLMVVSSHDFTDVLEKDSRDWARYQLLNAHDLSLTGNPWVDCMLSAGLSPHRAHHIFPYQKSGFANIYSNQILKVAAKKHGLPWEKPKNFYTEVFPVIFRENLWSPVADPVSRKPKHASFWEEHTDPACYLYILNYIYAGFLGIGSL
jgi:hypothetical protein